MIAIFVDVVGSATPGRDKGHGVEPNTVHRIAIVFSSTDINNGPQNPFIINTSATLDLNQRICGLFKKEFPKKEFQISLDAWNLHIIGF